MHAPKSPAARTTNRAQRRLRWNLRAALFLLAAPALANAEPSEHELKAAYIARFTEFITWPAAAEGFSICVYGVHPIQAPLEKLPRLMTVNDRPIDVRRIDHPEAAAHCDILFVPAAENAQLPRIRKYTATRPVLTINEIPGLAHAGQLISLYLDGNRLRLEIHLREAEQAGFTISSRLLKLATVVD